MQPEPLVPVVKSGCSDPCAGPWQSLGVRHRLAHVMRRLAIATAAKAKRIPDDVSHAGFLSLVLDAEEVAAEHLSAAAFRTRDRVRLRSRHVATRGEI